ncbi:N-acetyltransferase [Chloroflexi bacterium TSY]|nr:N-acetyltransferase [Chloroflexi bacterium TSY]
MPPIKIRPETHADIDEIHKVVTAAFGQPQEADLVNLIRDRGKILISLVAERSESLIGHILISPITLVPDTKGSYAGIASLSVHPTVQNQGIGGALMTQAIKAAQVCGISALFVLGNPKYYARFGFQTSHIANEYGAKESFMHYEIIPCSLQSVSGLAKYVNEFSEVGI